MPVIRVITEGDLAWADLRERIESRDPTVILAMGNDVSWMLTLLKGGMASGAYSVGLRLDLPDGRVLLTETSWQALEIAIHTLREKVNPIQPRRFYGGGGRFA